MRRVRFVAAARREFLAEVIFYNEERAGLGARFTAAVEETTARAAAFPLTGSHASESYPACLCQRFSICGRLSGYVGRNYCIRSRTSLSPSRLLAVACSRPLTGHDGYLALGCDANGILRFQIVRRQPPFGGGAAEGIDEFVAIYFYQNQIVTG